MHHLTCHSSSTQSSHLSARSLALSHLQLLSHLFRHVSPSRLISLRVLLQQSSSLSLYSERHFNRIDKLLTKSFLMDYMLNAMKTVEPDQKQTAVEEGPNTSEEATRVIQQILEGVPLVQARAPTVPSSIVASVVPITAADQSDDEDAESDDDAAWATNWQDADSTPAAAEPEPTTVATQSRSAKRKEPEATTENTTSQSKKQKKAGNKK